MAEALLTSDPIPLQLRAGIPYTLRHGMGREPKGWLLIWSDAHVSLRAGHTDHPHEELVLVSDADVNVRILLL